MEKYEVTFGDLYKEVLAEIEKYDKSGQLDELMKSKVNLNLCDQEGNVLHGYATMFVGWSENGDVIVTGNLTDANEQKGN